MFLLSYAEFKLILILASLQLGYSVSKTVIDSFFPSSNSKQPTCKIFYECNGKPTIAVYFVTHHDSVYNSRHIRSSTKQYMSPSVVSTVY